MQADGLIHRQQLMKSIFPRRANSQPEINLRERSHRNRHGRMIVKASWRFDDWLGGQTLGRIARRSYTCCHFEGGGCMISSSAQSQGHPEILLLFVAVAFAAAIRVFGWNYIKAVMASGWSMTQGRVEYGSVEEHRVRYFTYYIARIDYSYSFNNEYYS